MRRALAIVACLVAGHTAAAGLFWALVNVPESNLLMLGLSAVLVALIVVALGWTEATALLSWRPDVTVAEATRRGLTRAPAILAAAAVFSIFWWATARADAWLAEHAGEIDAWLIATVEMTRTAWVHRTFDVVLFLGRYAAGVSLAVAALGAVARNGWGALPRPGWLRAGLSRRHLGLVGAAMTLLVFLPLQAVAWRPEALPPNAIEIAFAAVKLGTIFLVANVGWALVLWTAARQT
jgi:hypothetical protein